MDLLTIDERIEAKISALAEEQGVEPEALGWEVHVHEKNAGGRGVGGRIDTVDGSHFDENHLRTVLSPGVYWLRLFVDGKIADNIPLQIRPRATAPVAGPLQTPAQVAPAAVPHPTPVPMPAQVADPMAIFSLMFKGQQDLQNLLIQVLLDRKSEPNEFERTLKMAKMFNDTRNGGKTDDGEGDMGGVVRELVAAFPAMREHLKASPPAQQPLPTQAAAQVPAAQPVPSNVPTPDEVQAPLMMRFFLDRCYRNQQPAETVGAVLKDQLVLLGVPIVEVAMAMPEQGQIMEAVLPGGIPGVPAEWLGEVEIALRLTIMEDQANDDDSTGEREERSMGTNDAGGGADSSGNLAREQNVSEPQSDTDD